MRWLVQSVTQVLQTLEFYIRLFFLKLDTLLPLALTNMFPIVTLTSFETMSEPRSAVLISSCFSQNSNNSNSLSQSYSKLGARSKLWPRLASK